MGAAISRLTLRAQAGIERFPLPICLLLLSGCDSNRYQSAAECEAKMVPLIAKEIGRVPRAVSSSAGTAGQLGIGHDRGRVRIDEDDTIALLLQRLDRLRARIIELARLADDDRSCADDEDRGDVGAFWH